MLSDAELTVLLRARNEAVRLFVRLQPELRQFEAAQREVQKMQPAIDELIRSYSTAAAVHGEYHALPLPAAPAPAPKIAWDSPEKVALREEIEQLRSERDAYADQLYDVFLTLAFGGSENEVSPEDLYEN